MSRVSLLYSDIPDLPRNAFTHIGDKRIKPEGGGKGGGGSSTTTVQQSVPKELVPYIKEVIDQGRNVAALPYQPYGGQRTASFTPEQKAVQAGVMGLQTPKEFKKAMRGAEATGDLGYSTAQRGLNRALNFTPGTFSGNEAAYYADPYQQAVTNIALREAQRSGDIAARNANLQAAAQGNYGAARNALMQSELQRNLSQNLSDIQARGSEAGYQNAQQQFERDRAAAAAAAQLAGQVGTSGLSTSLQSSLGLGQLAGQYQGANLQNLEAKRAIAQQIQDQNQKVLSQRYQDFLSQKGYPKETVAFLSDLVRGNAPLYGTVQQTTTPAPNLLSQLAGLGGAGYTLGKLTNTFAEGGHVSGLPSISLAKLG